MALSATIKLKYPWIAVTQTANVIGVIAGAGYGFANVEQINPNTTEYLVGDRVYFKETTSSDPVIIIGTTQYSLISEEKIFFTEPIPTPP